MPDAQCPDASEPWRSGADRCQPSDAPVSHARGLTPRVRRPVPLTRGAARSPGVAESFPAGRTRADPGCVSVRTVEAGNSAFSTLRSWRIQVLRPRPARRRDSARFRRTGSPTTARRCRVHAITPYRLPRPSPGRCRASARPRLRPATARPAPPRPSRHVASRPPALHVDRGRAPPPAQGLVPAAPGPRCPARSARPPAPRPASHLATARALPAGRRAWPGPRREAYRDATQRRQWSSRW